MNSTYFSAYMPSHISAYLATGLTRMSYTSLLLGLMACTTPTQYPKQDICQQDNSNLQVINKESCHYYGRETPYNRSIEADTNGLTQPQPQLDTQQQSLTMMGPSPILPTPLSYGDKLNIQIIDGEEFSGQVEVNQDGYIYLPFLPPIFALSENITTLKAKLSTLLISNKILHPELINISITPIQWAPIQVSVSGAVFEPGLHLINQVSDKDKTLASSFIGDQAAQRTLAAALKSSGGVSPNADITQIVVTRAGKQTRVNLSGIITGIPVPSLTLVAGDHIYVPKSLSFNDKLARPSQITVPGIRVFISNLTQPASSNSQSAVDTEATRFPYGTRLLSGAIAANCIGGAQSTNASRHILLITKNPMTQEMDIIERSLDKLMYQSWQANMNPILLPGDGIACYDSGVTNIREIAKTLTEVILPLTLLGAL